MRCFFIFAQCILFTSLLQGQDGHHVVVAIIKDGGKVEYHLVQSLAAQPTIQTAAVEKNEIITLDPDPIATYGIEILGSGKFLDRVYEVSGGIHVNGDEAVLHVAQAGFEKVDIRLSQIYYNRFLKRQASAQHTDNPNQTVPNK